MKNVSQLPAYMNGTVILKAGKQTLERDGDGDLWVSNGSLSSFVILYNNTPKWWADGAFRFSMPIRQKLGRLAIERYENAPRVHTGFLCYIGQTARGE